MISRWWCRQFGHDWFMTGHQSDHVPIRDICLRCGEHRVIKPVYRFIPGSDTTASDV